MTSVIPIARSVRLALTLSLGVVGWPSSALQAAGGFEFRTVVLEGQPLPGTSTGHTFDIAALPVINDVGQVAFWSQVELGGRFAGNGVWSERDGGLHQVVRSGTPAPGSSGAFGQTTENFVMDDTGRVTFATSYDGNQKGIWTEQGDNLLPVRLQGAPAPGTLFRFGHLWGASTSRVVGNGRRTLFWSDLDAPDASDSGLWSEVDGVVTLLARERDLITRTPSTLLLGELGYYGRERTPTVSDLGKVAFIAPVTGSTVNTSNDAAIFVGGDEDLKMVLRKGDPAPGLDGVTFGALNSIAMNNAGELVFESNLSGAGITSQNDVGVWLKTASDLKLIARSGDPAPGFDPGMIFVDFESIRLNAHGQIAFFATVGAPGSAETTEGIWTDRTGALELVVRIGQQAPDSPPGVVFEDFDGSLSSGFNSLAFNASGNVAFNAFLAGTLNGHGVTVFAEVDHVLKVIVQDGGVLESQGTSFRFEQPGMLSYSGNEDGFRSAFNDRGELAFYAFANGVQGLFVVRTIPEPAGGLMLVMASLSAACLEACATRRSRRLPRACHPPLGRRP